MNAEELKAKYQADLRERLKALVDEQRQIEEALTVGGVRKVTDELPPTGRKPWTPERRKAQSRRMKKLHREGKFR